MAKRNPSIAKLHAQYLFPLMAQRKKKLLEEQPNAHVISLGIGDTTEPIPTSNAEALAQAAQRLTVRESYTGYCVNQGSTQLRQSLADVVYGGRVDPDEIFISDGSKCDIGRLQVLFGPEARVAVQDPAYPAYVFSSVIMGQTGEYNAAQKHYERLVYLPCTPQNDFFPDLNAAPQVDVLFFCAPNNPTGMVPTREQLVQLVQWAKANRTIIIYDTAYASYIQDEALPRSIYEIPGARDVAIETGSFSKMLGYTGVRLGWTVVPEELSFDDGTSVRADWQRIMTTYFNGACNLAQAGGEQALTPQGLEEMNRLIQFYLQNAEILRKAVVKLGLEPFGGVHAPYLWVPFPGKPSWDIFEQLLEQAHLVVTPGIGFGPAGEGFVRLSAFGHREEIEEAAARLLNCRVLQAT